MVQLLHLEIELQFRIFEKNTIVFKLHVQCKVGQPRITVKSDQLKWLPNGSELIAEYAKPNASSKPKTFTSFSCSQDSLPEFSSNPPGFKDSDIILAKLGPGQEIEVEVHAVKGICKTHAKWSPVATAWYRMLPEVVLLEDVEDELAEELKNKCPVGVFDIEDVGKGRRRASVARPRACTLCRECIRGGKEWEDVYRYVVLKIISFLPLNQLEYYPLKCYLQKR